MQDHIVWILKYRKKAIFIELRKYLGEILRELAKQAQEKEDQRLEQLKLFNRFERFKSLKPPALPVVLDSHNIFCDMLQAA